MSYIEEAEFKSTRAYVNQTQYFWCSYQTSRRLDLCWDHFPLYTWPMIYTLTFVTTRASRLSSAECNGVDWPVMAMEANKILCPRHIRRHGLLYLSGASGKRSITYFPLATDMIGTYSFQYILMMHCKMRRKLPVKLTPGIFLILLFRSRSFVATI